MSNERANRRLHPLLGWALALLATAAFSGLGFWQLGRAKQKEAMLAAVHEVLDARAARPMDAELAASGGGYAWIEGPGRFIAAPRLLLDNQLRDGHAGVRAYCLFVPAGGSRSLLVELGWLALDGRRDLPSTACPEGEVRVRGLLAPPPSAGLRLGPAQARIDADAWLATRIELAEARRLWPGAAPLASRVLKLDPALPVGYARDLDILPNTLPPERHLGYAVQWFGLALAVFVTALLLDLRRRRRAREKMAA